MNFKNPLTDEYSLYRSFDAFWNKFHFENKQYKTNKQQAELIWENKPLELKIKAFKNIKTGKGLTGYDYLKKQFIVTKKI